MTILQYIDGRFEVYTNTKLKLRVEHVVIAWNLMNVLVAKYPTNPTGYITTCVESRFPPGSLESVVVELVLYLASWHFSWLVYTGMSQRPNILLVRNWTITHLQVGLWKYTGENRFPNLFDVQCCGRHIPVDLKCKRVPECSIIS